MIPEWMLLAGMTPEQREDYRRNSEAVRAIYAAVERRSNAPR
jgi:hypothetical protein